MRRHAWRCKEAACGTLAESRFTATAAPMLQLRSSRWRMALSILRWRRMQTVWTQWMAADHDGWAEQSQSGAEGREQHCDSEPSGDFVADSGAFGAGSANGFGLSASQEIGVAHCRDVVTSMGAPSACMQLRGGLQ